ncbi:hypothetical protein FB451DRAFT_1231647, partial [Mycena latifolia]
MDPEHITLPPSPIIATIPLPADSVDRDDSSESVDGIPLNIVGDPDFEPGVIIDMLEPAPLSVRSALEETALEHHVNVTWLSRYRSYTTNQYAEALALYEHRSHEELRSDPLVGGQVRAHDMLAELRKARPEEECISNRGPGFDYTPDLAQVLVSAQLGERRQVHELNLLAKDRKAQAVITRRMLVACNARFEEISTELGDPLLEEDANTLWEQVRTETTDLYHRLSVAID